jgi:hypothetical protein
MSVELTEGERKAVKSAIKGSIDLYSRYITLAPETPAMKRKQSMKRKERDYLKRALLKL